MNAMFCCSPRPIGGRRGGVIQIARLDPPVPSAETAPGALRRLSSIALSSSWATCCIKRSMPEIFMNWRSTAGKSALVKMLMKEHGFSKRKSEKAVNAVFDCMARALRRGEVVELPIGWIQTAPPPANREKRKWQRFRNIQINRKSQTKKIFSKIVTYPDKIIRFRANPRLIVKGPGPPAPLSPEMINKGEELEQLLARLGFPDVTGAERGIAGWRRRGESGLAAVPLADVGPGRTHIHQRPGPPRLRPTDVLDPPVGTSAIWIFLPTFDRVQSACWRFALLSLLRFLPVANSVSSHSPMVRHSRILTWDSPSRFVQAKLDGLWRLPATGRLSSCFPVAGRSASAIGPVVIRHGGRCGGDRGPEKRAVEQMGSSADHV